MSIRPTTNLLYLLLLWLIWSLIASFITDWLWLWYISTTLLIILISWQAWRSYLIQAVEFNRQAPNTLSLGVWSEISIIVHNPYTYQQNIAIFDHYPLPSEYLGLPQRLLLQPKQSLQMRYNLRPLQRGAQEFVAIETLTTRGWGLWQKYHYIKCHTAVKIYPNIAVMSKYAWLATQDRLGQMGVKRLPRRGEGLEFHQLREYLPEDNLRQIDWNASARLNKLISKQYQDERDQRVIFLLDCGRRMRAQDDDLAHFDHSLNAVLLLSYVALRQGDAVGLMTFSGEQRWLAARKGLNSILAILNAVYDLQPTMQTSDYLQAAKNLSQRLHKRALVVLISNLRDEDQPELVAAMKLLGRRHLVLLASLQENILQLLLKTGIDDFSSALRYAATQEYLYSRRQAHESLQQHGILYLDSSPKDLPIALINRYWEIKRSGRL